MNQILLPTSYLASIEYFVHILRADKIWIEIFETYPKQTCRNRCRIYTANGPLDLSIPVSKVNGNHTFTKDIAINNTEAWQKKHWRAIESAYNASPFFLYYKDEMEEYYNKGYDSLLEFNQQLLEKTLQIIGIDKKLYFTNDFEKSLDNISDLRTQFNPQKESPPMLIPRYFQVFENKFGFIPNLSIIDLLFSEGPNTLNFLDQIKLAE